MADVVINAAPDDAGSRMIHWLRAWSRPCHSDAGCRKRRVCRAAISRIALVAALHSSGCAPQRAPVVESIRQSAFGPITVAVAPALNFTGRADVDPYAAAALMASELTTIDGVAVIPVSRVVAALAGQGHREVESPQHAAQLARQVGADAILVFSVNEYEPYAPPIVGLTAQLYGVRPDLAVAGVDSMGADGGQAADPASTAPVAQSQRVYHGASDAVVSAVKRFADLRDNDLGPLGWRRVLASQEWYLRFCCYCTAGELLGGAATTVEPRVDADVKAERAGE